MHDRFWQVSLLRSGYAIEVIATQPEVAAMFLELHAVSLLEELHRTLESDRRREAQNAERRAALLEACHRADSDRPVAVPIGDRASRLGDTGSNLGRGEDLHPAARAQ
jgi:hypothetical protein